MWGKVSENCHSFLTMSIMKLKHIPYACLGDIQEINQEKKLSGRHGSRIFHPTWKSEKFVSIRLRRNFSLHGRNVCYGLFCYLFL